MIVSNNLFNQKSFVSVLEKQYIFLFKTDDLYLHVKNVRSPLELAVIMVKGLVNGQVSKDCKAVRRACALLCLDHTDSAIHAFLCELEPVLVTPTGFEWVCLKCETTNPEAEYGDVVTCADCGADFSTFEH